MVITGTVGVIMVVVVGVLVGIEVVDFEEDEFARFGGCASAAEVAGGDAGFEDGGDGVVGVELGAWAAVGVHVGEDADGGGVSWIDEDDAVFVGGHGDGADLVDLEGYVELFVVDGFVGLGVDDLDLDWLGLGLGERWNCGDGEE